MSCRPFPQGATLRGFVLGGRAGVYHLPDQGKAGTAFGLGFEIGYTWLLGARRNVGLTLGAGLTRIVAGKRHPARRPPRLSPLTPARVAA